MSEKQSGLARHEGPVDLHELRTHASIRRMAPSSRLMRSGLARAQDERRPSSDGRRFRGCIAET
ncbi:hypothetical protein DCO57_18125 [Labrenzia sp. 011]|nr:hypothetical protein DCO57_18125 [Labrenzia sp. 011]